MELKPSERIEAQAKALRDQYPYWSLESVRYHALLWYLDQLVKAPEPIDG